MKRRFPSIAASLILALSAMVIPKQRTFTGEIMDSECGAMGLHGIVGPLQTTRQCTIDCVRSGAQYVLYDPSVQMAYGLDDQRKPETFASEKVAITGTVDRTSNIIHVYDIHSAE
jgi:hypothetical protein